MNDWKEKMLNEAAIRTAAVACSDDRTRYVLTHVKLTTQKDGTTLAAATDGRMILVTEADLCIIDDENIPDHVSVDCQLSKDAMQIMNNKKFPGSFFVKAIRGEDVASKDGKQSSVSVIVE